MGSAIATPFQNELERDQMLRFISLNYRPFVSLFDKGEEDEWISYPTHKISYVTEDPIIGFEYKTCPIEYKYPFRVCSWMALQRGQKHHVCWLEDQIEEMPFILYGGYDPIYLLKNKPIVQNHQIQIVSVDDVGFYPITSVSDVEEYGDVSKVNDIIHQEIKRLDSLWRQAIG